MDKRLRNLERQAILSGDSDDLDRFKHAYDQVYGEGAYWRRESELLAQKKRDFLREIADELESAIQELGSDEPNNEFWDEVHDILLPLYEDGSLNRYDGYAPGSGDPDVVVFAANWNTESRYDSETNEHIILDDSMSRIGNLLEALPGVELDWSDEVSSCDNCYKAISTRPTHWGWTPPYADTGEGRLCRGCLQVDPQELFDSLIGNPNTALSPSLDINPAEHGYTHIPTEYETGFHPGQNDSPQAVSEILDQAGLERYFFAIDSTGQFDVDWSIWIETEELLDWVADVIEEQDLDVEPTTATAIQHVLELLS